MVTEDDASVQIKFYARGLAATQEQVCSGSIAFLEDANVIPVPVSEDADKGRANSRENNYRNYEPGVFSLPRRSVQGM